MADAIRRSHARIPCDRHVEVHHGATGRPLGAGRMLNVSLSGAYVAFPGELQRGTPYRLRVLGPEGPVDLPGRVVREGPRAGPKAPGVRQFGMVFNLSADQERLLRRLLDVMRRQPAAETEKETGLDRSLRSYWS
ncbi:MAG TPA: PilZ domain-containing protein [Elusimicrobiota bacterium]|nr:PilZ domain-containing protein [Elusimicrobiota bacterium]